MKRLLTMLAGIGILVVAGIAVEAQQPPTFPITAQIVLEQFLQQFITAVESFDVVNNFITRHPNLPGFAQLALAVPNNPQVFSTFDGNFRTTFVDDDGVTRVREFMGQTSTLFAMANAILTASSPTLQLAQYQSMYTNYGSLYNQFCTVASPPAACFNLPLPAALTNPATLVGAPLSSIVSAQQTLGDVALNVLKIVPIADLGALVCSDEVGATTKADNILFGDQTNSGGSCKGSTPSASGILTNFNWYNKNLLTCVREQGARGSCHIFGSTSAMEELIARDTGNYVNLSEQDFMENEKLIWGPAYFGDGGDAATDLGHAQTNKYKFAYEKQWDYNPSWSQPRPPASEYVNSCNNYPLTEPGCSNTAPQAPAVFMNATPFFTPAVLSGARSPYMSDGAISLWDPANKDLSLDKMILALAFSEAVIWEFKVTHNFKSPSDGYVVYSTADANDTANYLGGHVVHLVGFVSNTDLASNPKTASVTPDPKGIGYFIIKNSWGTCSGDAGYYYVPVAYLFAVTNDVLAVGSESH
jgi:hypothetical protein